VGAACDEFRAQHQQGDRSTAARSIRLVAHFLIAPS
jgi:hypothetical protein